MLRLPIEKTGGRNWLRAAKEPVSLARSTLAMVTALTLLLGAVGCQTDTAEFLELHGGQNVGKPSEPNVGKPGEPKAAKSDSIVLREGDVVKITFPGAPNLNTTQAIRRDGKIALQLVGEVKAAGMTPTDMEKELLKLYAPQLQTKEVSVTVESSAFPVYVTGAVLRPGKIMSDRPLTALEAIMEAGGFDYAKANLKKVSVVRHENDRTDHFTLNLKGVLQGEKSEQFNLKPSDIVYVPERFSWF